MNDELASTVRDNVAAALSEDVGPGDLTGELISPDTMISATVITREDMTMAGRPWFDEVCRQVDDRIAVAWLSDDGDSVQAGAVLCEIELRAGHRKRLLKRCHACQSLSVTHGIRQFLSVALSQQRLVVISFYSRHGI